MENLFKKLRESISSLRAELDHSKTAHEVADWFEGAAHEILRIGEKEALAILPVVEAGAKTAVQAIATKKLGGIGGEIGGAVATGLVDAAAGAAEDALSQSLEDSAPKDLDSTGRKGKKK
jgi:hypothetical protein